MSVIIWFINEYTCDAQTPRKKYNEIHKFDQTVSNPIITKILFLSFFFPDILEGYSNHTILLLS